MPLASGRREPAGPNHLRANKRSKLTGRLTPAARLALYMPDATAIDVQGLRKVYRDGLLRGRRVEALRGVSFQVRRGEIFGLLGPNGAGKTTLIKVLLGIVRRSGGNATLLGRPPGDRQGRKHVGYLPENHRIPRHHTGDTALEYYGMLSGMSGREIRRRRPELLKLVGLEDWGRTSVKKYSKGMQQRLGLAQSLMHQPQVLFLDEPTDGVDPVGRSEMRTLLQRLKGEGKTIFLNSHQLQEVELICDRVVILDRGLVGREGHVSEITQQSVLEVAFTVEGTETAVRVALGERPLVNFKQLAAQQFQAVVGARDQSEVNRMIDDLRRGGIGIVEITRPRRTLEEAFLEVVAEDRN